MANVASQVILHPVVSQSVKVAATTVGRDKVSPASDNRLMSGQRKLMRHIFYLLALQGSTVLCEILSLVPWCEGIQDSSCEMECSQVASRFGQKVSVCQFGVRLVERALTRMGIV